MTTNLVNFIQRCTFDVSFARSYCSVAVMVMVCGRHVGFDNDGHNHDDQLCEIYPTMLNELNCTFGVSFPRFYCCGRHGIGPSAIPPAVVSQGFDNDGHNHDDQLGEIYPTMLNDCTFGVSFARFYCCGRHGHGLWPSWYKPVSHPAGRRQPHRVARLRQQSPQSAHLHRLQPGLPSRLPTNPPTGSTL